MYGVQRYRCERWGIEFITYGVQGREGGDPTDELKTEEFLAMMSMTSRL